MSAQAVIPAAEVNEAKIDTSIRLFFSSMLLAFSSSEKSNRLQRTLSAPVFLIQICNPSAMPSTLQLLYACLLVVVARSSPKYSTGTEPSQGEGETWSTDKGINAADSSGTGFWPIAEGAPSSDFTSVANLGSADIGNYPDHLNNLNDPIGPNKLDELGYAETVLSPLVIGPVASSWDEESKNGDGCKLDNEMRKRLNTQPGSGGLVCPASTQETDERPQREENLLEPQPENHYEEKPELRVVNPWILGYDSEERICQPTKHTFCCFGPVDLPRFVQNCFYCTSRPLWMNLSLT